MPTPPFGPARVTALKESNQSARTAMLKQWEDNPEFFCCISGNTVGVGKDPVPILTISDRVTCIGVNFTVSFALSWSPTSTLAGQAYSLDWGDGSPPVNGNFPNPRNPAAETATKAGGYAAVGYYDITIEVTDAVGATATTRLQVYARDCSQPANPLPFPPDVPEYDHPIWDVNGAIVCSDNNAWYTLNWNAALPVWGAFVGGPPGCTEIHDGMLEMELSGSEYLYIADFSGIFMHAMPPWDAGGWTALTTANQMAAAAGVDTSTHTCYCQRLAVSITQDGWQWCSWVGQRTAPHNVDYYVGVAHTRDGWNSIQHSSIVATVTYNAAWTQELLIWGIDIVQHDDGQTVFAAIEYGEQVGVTEETRLYRSIDWGQSWVEVDSRPNPHRWADVWVPFDGAGADVYWCMYDTLRVSSDWGSSWATAAVLAGTTKYQYMRLAGPIDSVDVATFTIDRTLYEYRGGAVSTLNPVMPGTLPAYGFLVRTRDASKYATHIQWIGGWAPAISYIKENVPPLQNNKEGGYADYYPAACPWPELREYST